MALSNRDRIGKALDSMERLLRAVSAAQAREVERNKQELLRVVYAEQARQQTRAAGAMTIEGQPQSGIKPWREIVTPHPDVAAGRFIQAEFAADLSQVYRNQLSPEENPCAEEYRDPREFFARTFITGGLRQLLRDALLRLSGKGGDPVVELQTNFGGGKTHSMLALYHLFSDVTAADLAGMEPVLKAAGVPQPPPASADVPDEMEARLVVLGPEYPHTAKAKDSPAIVEAKTILDKRGNCPRLFHNMLVFLAADKQRLADLEAGIRQYLAWVSIDRDRKVPLILENSMTA